MGKSYKMNMAVANPIPVSTTIILQYSLKLVIGFCEIK
jgi:hypothetical protein